VKHRHALALAAFAALILAPPALAQRPPPVALVTQGGVQRAVQESYCVLQTTETGGVTLCADTADLPPRRFSPVRAGERVTIRIAAVRAGGVVVIRSLARDGRAVTRFRLLRPVRPWRVRLPAGRYEIEVAARFATADGRRGETNVTLGLAVRRG
jgi:hypothetical protein